MNVTEHAMIQEVIVGIIEVVGTLLGVLVNLGMPGRFPTERTKTEGISENRTKYESDNDFPHGLSPFRQGMALYTMFMVKASENATEKYKMR